jgi:choline-glycine betaine transporter
MPTPLRAGVLITPFMALFFVFVAGWSGYGPSVSALAQASLAWLMGSVGWAFVGVGIAVIVVSLIAFSVLGTYRIGGRDTKPGHSAFTAVAIGVAASTSMGLLFWATAEPLYHVHQPPRSLGLLPLTDGSQVFARYITIIHWAIIAPILNALCMVVFGLTVQNLKRRPTLDGVASRAPEARPVGSVLDGSLVFFATLMAVGAFASCTLALSGEMTRFGSTGPNPAALFALALAMVFVIFVAGARPIRTVYSVLARGGLILMIIMMVATLIIGPTLSIIGGGLRALWHMIWALPSMLSFTGWSSGETWPQIWTMTHWGNAMLLAPLIGLFLSRAARGFGVGEAVSYFIVIPAVITMLWIIVFGGLALSVDQSTGGSIWATIGRGGADDASYAVLWSLPAGESLVVGFVMLIAVAFATFGAAILHAVMRICAPGPDDDLDTSDARASIATLWCAGVGLAGWGLASYGIGPVIDTMARLGSLPALFVTIAILIGALRLIMKPRSLNVTPKSDPVQIDFDLGDMIANEFDDDLDEVPLPRRKRRKSA